MLTPKKSVSLLSHVCLRRSMNIVRLAFELSVMCTPPLAAPVKLYSSHESTVPKRRFPSSCAFFTSGMLSSIQRSFTAAK